MPKGQSGKGESGKGGGGGKRRREEEEDPLFTPDNRPKKSRSTKDPTQDPALEEEEEEEKDLIVETQPGTSTGGETAPSVIVVEGPEEDTQCWPRKLGSPNTWRSLWVYFTLFQGTIKPTLAAAKILNWKCQLKNRWCPNLLKWPNWSTLYPVRSVLILDTTLNLV